MICCVFDFFVDSYMLDKYFKIFPFWIIILLLSCSEEKGYLEEVPFLKIVDDKVVFEHDKSEFILPVKCNIVYEYQALDGLEKWCSIKQTESGLVLAVAENTEKGSREGRLLVKAKTVEATVTVFQFGWGSSIELSKSSVQIDELGGNFTLDVTTNVDFRIDLDNCNWVNYTEITTRTEHDKRKRTFCFSVSPNIDGLRKTEISFIDVDPHSTIDVVKLVVNQKDMSKYMPELSAIESDMEFNVLTLFADQTCTMLKDGVTELDILGCKSKFYRKLAWYLYKKKYPTEFRIAEFKAYPDPNIFASKNKILPYSLNDNPAGISVRMGEKLIVMADLKGKDNIKLIVQNLEKQHWGEEYLLKDGMNVFSMKDKGLVYVLYQDNDYENAVPITLHFATGDVNGYFDTQNPQHQGRWNELLSGAVDRCFDLLGKYSHLTFTVDKFKHITHDGTSLANMYDEIVYREQEFMGLVKYGGLSKCRVYFHVMFGGYMAATNYRTCYNENTLDNIANEDLLPDNCWGPSHEVGHLNQLRPDLSWLGIGEVTNNIYSLHIQTSIFGQTSDLIRNGIYEKAWNDMIALGKSHAAGADVFFKLVPFWQLELYFGKVLGNTPLFDSESGGFYADVFEYYRKLPNNTLKSYGERQVEFAYVCSKISGFDLTDFFVKWGFLKPSVTRLDGDQLIVTDDMVANVMQRISAGNLKKMSLALEYITDTNVDLYKSPKDVVEGMVTEYDGKLVLSDWKNVVTYEVKDLNQSLLHIVFADNLNRVHEIPIEENWEDTCSIFAVSANGKRIRVK